MPYNKQANPYGIASSELGWKGFADGGRMGNPGALAPPKNTLLSDAALLGMSAALDGSGDWFGPSATDKLVGGDAMKGVDTAITDVTTAAKAEGVTEDQQELFKNQYDTLIKLKGDIAGSKDYNKPIYHKGTFEFGDAPKGGVLFKDLDNKYTNKEVMSKTFDKPFWKDTYTQKYIDDGKSFFGDTKKKLSNKYSKVKNEAGDWLDTWDFWNR
jgi:hypothetical protein